MDSSTMEKPRKRPAAPKSARTVVKAAAPKTPRATAARKAASSRRTAQARTPDHEAIAARAHSLYVQSGHQPGRDEEFWLEAERQLLAELNT